MGIHGNATCQMVLDGAEGTLVGQPHKGLAAMFVMMNAARIGVGMQSLGLTEVAYQNALAYAKERIQSRSLSGVKNPAQPADSILVHPDVRKMLLTAKAYAEGGRALNLYCALLVDQELHHPDEAVRKQAAEMVAMLTPIVKAFITDNGWIATSACMQVLGGHGFIREWGMEQFVRDARINMIYEGTNTIQSLDLLGRKVLGNQGATLKKFGQLISTLVAAESGHEEMAPFIQPLAKLMRWALRRWTICAWRATWCLVIFGRAWRRLLCKKSPRAATTPSTRPSFKQHVFIFTGYSQKPLR